MTATLAAAGPRTRGRGRWVTLVIVAMVLTIVVLTLTTSPPTSRVLTSDPVDGSVLTRAPAAVTITFSDAPATDNYHLSVVPATGGAAVSRGPARLTGTELTVPVAITADGEYLATYHVVLGGDDVAAGSVRFGVGSAGQAAAAGSGGDSAGGHDHGSRDPWNVVLLVVDLALVGAAVFLLFRRPRGHSGPAKPWRLPSERQPEGEDVRRLPADQ